MSAEKSSVAVSLSKFISSLFHNFPRLLLTNLLFAIPFGAFFTLFWFINTFTGINSIFILFLTAIPVFPFYAGVVQVTSHMARGEESVSVFSNFINGIKENFLRFLVHGVVFYLAIFFSYFSISMYSSMGAENGVFYSLLVISILIAVFFLFMFFYVPPMTVTFDISMKNIYKNSALMTFGEFKNNIIAVIGLIFLALLCATALLCCTNTIALIIVTIIISFLFLPSFIAFVINSSVYKPMYSMIVDKDAKSSSLDSKIENRRNGQLFDKETYDAVADENLKKLEIDENADGDEYIFYNGKMVKRSVLLKLKKEAEEKELN